MTEDDARRRLWQADEDFLGKFGEAIWANVFRWSGVPYIPLHRIEIGRAPVIEGKNRVVLPDFELLHDKYTLLLDSKCKKNSIVFRLKNQERHGINESAHVNYMLAAARKGCPCALGVVECFRNEVFTDWSGSLLIETLSNLGDPRQEFREYPQPKVYWPRKSFRDLSSYTALELFAIQSGTHQVSFAYEFERMFGKKEVQVGLFD